MYIHEFIAMLLVRGIPSHYVEDSYRPACNKSSDLLTTLVASSNIISYGPRMLQHLLGRNKLFCSSHLFCVPCFVLNCSKYFRIKFVKVACIQFSQLIPYLTNERINSIEHDVCREDISSAACMYIPCNFF